MFLDKSYRLTIVLCRKNNDFAPAQLRQLEAQLGDLVHQQGDLALDQDHLQEAVDVVKQGNLHRKKVLYRKSHNNLWL